MSANFDSEAKMRVGRFLADYPVGHLHAVTGYTSKAGASVHG